MKNPTRWFVPFVAIVLALVLAPVYVFAHAAYDRSTPGRDEVVATAPARVDVWFRQDVFRQQGSNFVRVFDDQDTQVSQGDGVIDDNDRKHIYADLPPGLASGRYIVRWMTLSDEDGDTANGAFCFYVGVQPTAAQQAECSALAGGTETPTPNVGAASGTPTPTAAAATPAPTATSSGDSGGGGGGIPAVAVVGVVIAAAVVVVGIGGAVAMWLRRELG